MIIYFVRHGESEGNKSQTHQTVNTPLSAEGNKQAKSVGKRLKNINFDLIYSSDAVRTRQTTENINKFVGAKVEYWMDLREIRGPSIVENKAHNDPETRKIMDIVFENFRAGHSKHSDEESFTELNSRAKKVLDHLQKNHVGQTILVVSHAAMIKAMVGRLVFGEELTGAILVNMRIHMNLKNTGVTICEKHPVYGWQLNTWNDLSHI